MEERYDDFMARKIREAQANEQSDNKEMNFIQYGKDEHEVYLAPHLVDKLSTEEDMVNNPTHYNKSGIECIDAIQSMTDEGFEYYLQGNIMKYLWRYRYKNGVEDLKKAEWYLHKLIKIRDGHG
jgi:hypothetical protein|tara:strand:+ start:266 stop:637 length:372 start_codon:yes stop_codon:yes gene_type:complete